MNPRILYRATFKSDAADVWEYIGQDAPDRADAVLAAIDDVLEMLARHPQSGRSRDELAEGIRSFLSGRYLIYYAPLDGGGIEAIRLLHTARDVEGLW